MRLALIPPVSWLATSATTTYQLMLPHLFSSLKYTDYFRRLAYEKTHHLILDNGEAEGENNLPVWKLFDLAISIQANELVVPDVMGNHLATVNYMDLFFKEFDMIQSQGYLPLHKVKDLKFMVVVQGNTVQEARDCIDMIMQHAGGKIHTLALPRHLIATTDIRGVRLDLADDIFQKYIGNGLPNLEIHCLGAAPSFPREMLYLAQQGIVRGMDTSMPYNYAFKGWRIDALAPQHVTRPAGYFSLPDNEFDNGMLHHNIGVCKRWANGES